jgi:23S rRNA (guanosine2251-2'-O)-methyltransferase
VRDKVAGGSDARGADRRDGFGAGRSAGAAGKPTRSGFRPDQRKTEARPPAAVPERRADGPRTILRSPQSQDTRPPELRPAGGRAPAAPKGTLWIYGLHAVAAALANPNRRLRRLLLTEEAEATLATRLPPPWPLAPERGERARMDQMLGRDVVHQGIALLADPLAPPLLAQVMERPGPLLVLDQVTDPRNIGAILRSAAAFGAAGVIAQDRNAPEETGAMAKAASGALEVVPLIRAVNLARTLVALKAAGCWVVGLDAAGGRLDGPALVARRVALVLGAEDAGLRRLTRETCDELAGLAMPGGMESLNVSAAASVALYELTRRPA